MSFIEKRLEKLAQEKMGPLVKKMDELKSVLEEIQRLLQALVDCFGCGRFPTKQITELLEEILNEVKKK